MNAYAQASGGDGGFFHLVDVDLRRARCTGTACFVARHDDRRWSPANCPPVHCLGHCYRAPATGSSSDLPRVEIAAPTGIVLDRVVASGALTADVYRRHDGWAGLERALVDPERALHEVEISGLRGRGGAAFPVGRKWRAVREHHRHNAGPAYVVCNADEGDPGAYGDRVLLERDPFAILEGMAIAARIVGASRAERRCSMRASRT